MPLPLRHSSTASSTRLRASTPDTRPRVSRNTTTPSVLPESLILPDGPVGEEAAELLDEFVHPHHTADSTLVDSEESIPRDEIRSLPWWKTPSAWWLIILTPISAIATSATLAPRIELFTILACSILKPEIFETQNTNISVAPSYLNLISPLIQSDAIPAILNDAADPRQICAQDPVVQAAVAQLNAVLTSTMGVLSCLTTAWWGSLSDRYGRTRVMGISLAGLLLNDANFILVALFVRFIPGGYWFLLLGPIVEGLLGGLASSVAAMHAYIGDTTTSQDRSRMLSLALGLMFTGVAIGPAFGSLLIRTTRQTLSVFYFATLAHLLYAIIIWFFIPESLTKQQMLVFREKYAEEEEELRVRSGGRSDNILTKIVTSQGRRLFRFLSPLAIFLRDWNLCLAAASYGFTISIMGSYTYKFQYAASAFGWSAETIGYWISLVGAVRAAFLALLLPVIIKLFKPKPRSIRVPEAEALLSPMGGTSSGPSARRSPTPSPRSLRELHSPAFDLGLARASLFVEMVAYTFMALAQTALPFTIFGMLGSFGAGFSPAIQSVAMELYTRKGGQENGKLFGALSVIQALSSQILGPAIFGFTYMKTVATYPRAIFFLSVAAVTVSFLLVGLVRVPSGVQLDEEEGDIRFESPGVSREATLVTGGDRLEEENRTKKRNVLTITVSS